MDYTLPSSIQEMLWLIAADIVVVAVAVVAIITTAKHVGAVLDKSRGRCLDLPAVQVALEVAPLVIGAGLAVLPGLFDDHGMTFPLRAMFGVISGYVSPGIYNHLKRRLPGVMMSKAHRSEAGDGAPRG